MGTFSEDEVYDAHVPFSHESQGLCHSVGHGGKRVFL